MKKVKKTISILLCLLLLGGILSETGMQGGILPQTVQAAGRYTGWKTVSREEILLPEWQNAERHVKNRK